MNAKGYNVIPSELCYWITFLCKALPLRSIGTFIELLYSPHLRFRHSSAIDNLKIIGQQGTKRFFIALG